MIVFAKEVIWTFCRGLGDVGQGPLSSVVLLLVLNQVLPDHTQVVSAQKHELFFMAFTCLFIISPYPAPSGLGKIAHSGPTSSWSKFEV